MEKTLIVPRESCGERLDGFLSKNLSFVSRAKIYTLIKNGNILINGSIKKPSFHLKGKEEVSIKAEEETSELRPYEFPLKITYEDNDIIVIDKPSGLITHPPTKDFCKTLVNALIYLKKELSTLSPQRPGVVHRLDKETSGVMILAKNNHSHVELTKQFKERKIKKEYRAVVWGKLNKEHLRINLPLARDMKNRLRMKISFVKSKTALTEIMVLERFEDSTYLSIGLHTGRTHQIRVHLKFLGYPIIGDKKYGIKDIYPELMLHAHKLGIYHPGKGNFMEFVSPLPLRFTEFVRNYPSRLNI